MTYQWPSPVAVPGVRAFGAFKSCAAVSEWGLHAGALSVLLAMPPLGLLQCLCGLEHAVLCLTWL